MGKILKVREVGDPCLYQMAEKVEIIDSNIMDIINDMIETLHFTEGFGIAAPQIGINKRIIVIEVNQDKCRYQNCEDVPTTVMINPIWKKLSDETNIEYEGCLSVPNVRGKVKRFSKIQVTYTDIYATEMTKNVQGFTARNIQHECDHLDGTVFLDKVEEKGFASKDMIRKFDLIEGIQ